MKSAFHIGLSLDEYNEMTPYELTVAIRSFIDVKKQDYEHQLTCAWLTEYFHRTKRLPTLDKVLGKTQPKKVMTDQEMLEQVKLLNAAFGGNVVTKDGEV